MGIRVEFPAIDVDMGDPYLQPITEPVSPARSPADQGVRFGLEVIVVVTQAGDVNEPLGGKLHQPAEEAEVLDADDDRVERLADPRLGVGEQLDLGPAPRSAASARFSVLVRCSGQDASSSSKSLLGLLALEQGGQAGGGHQVGVASDRRGEVVVVFARQRGAPRVRACTRPACRLRSSP